MASYQSSSGSCDVTMIDLRPCRSSMISRQVCAPLASRGTRKRSSRMSSCVFFEFLQLCFDCSFVLAIFRAPISLEAFAYRTTHSGLAGLGIPVLWPGSFSCTGTAGDEQVVTLADKIQRGKTFHLVAVQATRQRVVDLCHRCVVVSEVRAFTRRSMFGPPGSPIPRRAASSGSCQVSLSRRRSPEGSENAAAIP